MEQTAMQSDIARLDHKIICDIVEPGSKVLDLGCGGGELLHMLTQAKNIKGQGIEISDEAIYKCVEKGLSVFHGDIDSGLADYPAKSFDYVILNQTMQQCRKAVFVIKESLRVGRWVVIGFPNFAFIAARLRMFFAGKTPVTESLPYNWYDTPNLHFLSISDFTDFCAKEDLLVFGKYFYSNSHPVNFWPNLLATNAIFVIG